MTSIEISLSIISKLHIFCTNYHNNCMQKIWSQNPTHSKSPSLLVITQCNKATSRYLSQCLLRSPAMSCLMKSDHNERLWLSSRCLLWVHMLMINDWLEPLRREMIDSWVFKSDQSQYWPRCAFSCISHWLRKWYGAIRRKAITRGNSDSDPCCHMASLGHCAY